VRRPKRLPPEELAPYLLDLPRLPPGADAPESTVPPPAPPEPLDWRAVFGNDRPVEVEVGFGKGAFLVAAAEIHPETNYLGVEVVRALQLYVATRLAKRRLTNVRVACTDARTLFRDRVPAASLAAVHVYCPDPWWKKRHQKRRIWTPAFATECVRVLRPGGRLHVATDVGEYYQVIRDLLDTRPGLALLRADETAGPPGPEELVTNFQRKALERGGSVYRAEYERREAMDRG
jgi:tRNA (guanine-N7-)-methyltransferase